MTFDLIQATDEHMCRDVIRGDKELHYYPSEASVQLIDEHGDLVTHGTCLRAAYYRCRGTEKADHNAQTMFIFRLGNTAERMLTDIWKEMGIWVGNSVKWQNTEYNLSGEVDVILKDPDTGLPFGVEVKSIHGYYSERVIMGSKQGPGFPKMNHLLQTLVYTWQFRDILDHFEIVYIMRDNGKRISFTVSLEPDIIEETQELVHRPVVNGTALLEFTMEDVLNRFVKLDNALKHNTLPDRNYELKYSKEKIEDYSKKGKLSKSKYNKYLKCKSKANGDWPGDWQCAYCNYESICWTRGGNPLDPTEEAEE